MELSSEDRSFLRALGRALAALSVSALLLMAIFIIHATVIVPGGANTSHSQAIAGAQLTPRYGEASAEGTGIAITGLQDVNHQSHALVSKRLVLRAESYPYVSYQFDGLNSGQRLHFIWRNAHNSSRLFTTPMPRNMGSSSTFNLASHPEWRGSITEVGVHLEGELRGSPLIIPALTFEPYGWHNRLAAVWSEWTSFRGWSGESINVLKGTSNPINIETLSPVLCGALWAGVALLILFVAGRYLGGRQTISYVIAVAVPWILIDLLWQQDLDNQLDDTRYLFKGKSIEERHLADVDGHIYQYAQRLKGDVLPLEDRRLFILHDSSGLNFERLKMQYYLLPHNVFNYGKFPSKRAVAPGDFILALGRIEGLEYDEERKKLIWGEKGRLAAKLVDRDELGSLYRVKRTPRKKRSQNSGDKGNG